MLQPLHFFFRAHDAALLLIYSQTQEISNVVHSCSRLSGSVCLKLSLKWVTVYY